MLLALEDIAEVIEYTACKKSENLSGVLFSGINTDEDEKVIEVRLINGKTMICEFEYYTALKHYLCDWPE